MAAGLVTDPSISTVVSNVVSAPAGAKWFDSFDDGLKNYITQRGLAEKDAATAFVETAKAHQEAQAYIGVPKERLLTLPAEGAPPEEWDALYAKLGFSTNKDDYKLETVTDEGLRTFVQTQAAALHLPPTAAAKFAGELAAHIEARSTAQTSEQQIANARAAEQLRQSWGPNYEANLVIADRAYAAMQAVAGFTAEQMAANMAKFKDVQGLEGTMQMLLAVGQRLGEDGFTGTGRVPANPNDLIASKEQAQARKLELMANTEWVKRFSNSGVAEMREMAALDMRIAGFNERGEPI